MPRVIRAEADIFKQQPDATLNQANPASGIKYTVLDTTKNARIIGISVQCTWTVQPTPLEIHLTIDGEAYIFTITDPVSVTDYYCMFQANRLPTQQILAVTSPLTYGTFLIEGRSVKVEAEITGGTVSNLTARVIYAKIP